MSSGHSILVAQVEESSAAYTALLRQELLNSATPSSARDGPVSPLSSTLHSPSSPSARSVLLLPPSQQQLCSLLKALHWTADRIASHLPLTSMKHGLRWSGSSDSLTTRALVLAVMPP